MKGSRESYLQRLCCPPLALWLRSCCPSYTGTPPRTWSRELTLQRTSYLITSSQLTGMFIIMFMTKISSRRSCERRRSGNFPRFSAHCQTRFFILKAFDNRCRELPLHPASDITVYFSLIIYRSFDGAQNEVFIQFVHQSSRGRFSLQKKWK